MGIRCAFMRAAIAGAAAAGLAGPCAADGISGLGLEDLLKVEVSGASRYAQPLAEAPSTASVIAAEDIRRFGFRDMAEALQSARGVYSSQDRAYTYLGVRGFNRPGDYNSRLLVMVDGARINNPVYDQAMTGNEAPIDLDWVKRLEFVPGSASASYGGNALFGVINAVLWSGAELNGTRLTLEAGDGRAGKTSLLAGGRAANGLDWVAGFVAYGRRGEDLDFPEHGGTARGLDAERYAKGMVKAELGGWRLAANVSERRKAVPTAYYDSVFNAPGNFNIDRELHLDLTHTRALSPTLDQQARVHLGHYGYDAEYPFTTALNRDESRANWWSAEYQLTWNGLRDHRILVGAELRRYTRLLQRNFDVAPRRDVLDDSHQGKTFGIFIQDEWRIAPRWLANLGLRLDKPDGIATIASPRMALIWRPRDDLTIKAIGGRAFRAPNDYERHYHDGNTTQKANPDLRPERIRTREIAFDYTPTPTRRLGVSHYWYTIRDLIDLETDPADSLNVFRNQGPMRAEGLELDGEVLLGDGWRLRGSVAWQRIRQDAGEAVNSPGRLGKLLIDGPVPLLGNGATLGLNLQAMSSRRSLAGRASGHLTGDLVLRARATTTSTWSLGLYNIGNLRYRDPVGNEQSPIDTLQRDGRQWRLRWELTL